jgi:NAD(P)-dependent dehydrogenase (short-subunit alcohol dehydrogenase family)
MSTDPGPTALITGAAGGIGSALTAAFLEAGYQVIALDRSFAKAGTVRDGETRLHPDLERCCLEPPVLASLMEEVRGLLGGRGLTVLVNNAATQILGRTEDVTVADWEATLRVNLIAPFLLSQALLPELKAGRGSILNIASIHASLTKPGFVAYATSKSALVGMTRAMAVDLGPRVRVNAILPAAVATPMLLEGFVGRDEAFNALAAMHPMGRIGEPSEVATVALYLASPGAGFITGATWQIDGGISGRLHDPV